MERCTGQLAATGSILLLACLSFALLTASPAAAAKTTVASIGAPTTGSAGARFSTPRGAAVSRNSSVGVAAGTFYVVDSANNRVQRFAPDGSFVSAWGWGVSDSSEEFQICKVAAGCRAGLAKAGPGALSSPQGIAIDQESGVVYVADQGNRRIDAFSATGSFLGAFGWKVKVLGAAEELQLCSAATGCQTGSSGTKGGQFNSAIGGLAIAPAGSPKAGDLYVANTTERRVEELKPTVGSGFLSAVSFVRAFGWDVETGGVTTFELCTVAANCKQGAAGTGLGEFAGGLAPGPRDVAVDSEGDVFAVDTGNKRLQEFSALPEPLSAEFGKTPPGEALTAVFGTGELLNVAIDPTTTPNHVLVSGRRSAGANRVAVAELDHAGENALGAGLAHGEELTPSGTTAGTGLAVAPASLGGNVYLSTATTGTLQGVYVLNEGPTVQAPSPVTSHAANFHGTVVSNGAEVKYHFEYSTDGSSWTRVPAAADLSVAATPGSMAVEAPSEAPLHGGTEYFVRLVAARPAGGFPLSSGLASFTTLASAPSVGGEAASAITASGARLGGEVGPENQPTEYQFEYGTSEAYGHAVPAVPAEVAASGGEVAVAEQLSGLSPGTIYHFRLVATNATDTTRGSDHTFTTYASPAGGLPDGRAYEQATPVEKNGTDVQGSSYRIQASAMGDAIAYFVTSGLPGGSGGEELPLYLAQRRGDAWSSQGLLPPPGYANVAKVIGWTEDLAQVFVRTTLFGSGPGSGGSLLRRNSDDGAIDRLTALVPNALNFKPSFVEASADGSKVFFEATGVDLSGDAAPGKPNLFVWDKASGQIKLVGVLPGGSTPPPGGSFAGPYEWRSGDDLTEGGAIQGFHVHAFHAVSADGSRAYFTAGETGKIYLRKDPAGPAPETVEVSASRKTDGGGLGGTDPHGPLPAQFMAATPSGSKAFFTSSEELTNDAHTAPTPQIGRVDLDGVSNKVSDFIPATATGVAVDASHVYWANPVAGAIGRATIDGAGNVTAIDDEFIAGLHSPEDVAVDASHIYWTSAFDGNAGEGTVGRADVTGTPASVDESFIEGAFNPRGIAVSGSYVYWANIRTGGNNGIGNMGRANITTEPPSEVNQAFITGAVDGDIAVDGAHIYYSRSNGTNGFVRRRDLDGVSNQLDSSNSTIMGPIVGARTAPSIVLDGSHLYWTNPERGVVGHSALDFTSPSFEFVKDTGHPLGLALDASHIYWSSLVTEPGGKDLYSYDSATGSLTDLVPDPSEPNGADVKGVLGVSEDGSRVYFVANGVLTTASNPQGEIAQPGTCAGAGLPSSGICNVYLWQQGEAEPDFVARLDAGTEDAANWSPGDVNSESVDEPKTSRISRDGGVLLFRSVRKLTAYDNGGRNEVYRYSAADGELTCISCDPRGMPLGGDATLQSIQAATIKPPNLPLALLRNLSADGDRAFFESPDPLVAGDVNGVQDVYEWEADGSGSCDSTAQDGGCLYLISGGTGTSPSFLADADEEGNNVFVFTRDRLVGQDRDDLVDIYDARVGGGLAAQNAAPPPACEGEACKGQPAPAPPAPVPGSAGFSGPGDQAPRHHRGRKRHRKHRRHHARHRHRHGDKRHHRPGEHR